MYTQIIIFQINNLPICHKNHNILIHKIVCDTQSQLEILKLHFSCIFFFFTSAISSVATLL